MEHSRIAASQPLTGGIDTSRYESLSVPETSDVAEWKQALQTAYTSHTYLTQRNTNLSLLQQFGKNAWLIGNSQLEDELRALEKELADTKEQIDVVNVQRRSAQEVAGGEIKGLDQGWKSGIGRVLEVEVAGEQVRRDILAVRRSG
jgi:pre-mRNA-splicing factor SPF27